MELVWQTVPFTIVISEPASTKRVRVLPLMFTVILGFPSDYDWLGLSSVSQASDLDARLDGADQSGTWRQSVVALPVHWRWLARHSAVSWLSTQWYSLR